ncbi:MAG: regulatory protein RecX [Sphingomonadaceae bacterium]
MTGKEQAERRQQKARTPLDEVRLRDLALAYVARFATTGTRLERYLVRKLRERGWAGEREPDVRGLVSRMCELGYIDDAAWAAARSNDLLRRGYGARRIGQTLGEAGVAEEVRRDLAPGLAAQRRAAMDLARRKRFGPFDRQGADPARHQKQLAAMVRAGHGFDVARMVLDAASVAAIEQWVQDAEEEERH